VNNGLGWRGVFFQSGLGHSLTSHAGHAWARSPWEAVQLDGRWCALQATRRRSWATRLGGNRRRTRI